MKFKDLKTDENYLREYIKLCSLEWGSKKTDKEMSNYIDKRINEINWCSIY